MKKKKALKQPSMHRWVPDPHNRARVIPNKKAYNRKKAKNRRNEPLLKSLAA